MVKQRILRLAYKRQLRPGRNPVEYLPDTVIWNGQKNGGSVVRACGGSGGGTKKRQSGGSCPVNFPPRAPTLTFRTGGPQPTCTSGTACGTGCKGFFCPAGNPLAQNPDFLDPRNPDSVQNPTGPYYGDWDGAITRSPSSSSSTVSTLTSTSQPAPAGPRPTPGHGELQLSGEMIHYQLRDSRGETHDFYGYDDSASTYCTPEPATWSNIGGQIAQVPATLTGITVYGDSSCRFAKSDMTLRCNKFAVATCVDATSGIHYGGGGTCRVDASQGIYQYYQVVLRCSW